MFIPTHLMIASNVFYGIKENSRIKLDYLNFLYGNIKPDIDINLIPILHYKKASFNFVMDIVDSIEFETLPTYYEQLKTFSMNLGIVNHYLADFFCYAHNNNEMDKFAPHFLYESSLAVKYYSLDLKKICSSSIAFAANIPNFDIRCYIEKKYKDYVNTEPSLNKDIIYSVEVCTVVSYLIVKKCLNNVLINIA